MKNRRYVVSFICMAVLVVIAVAISLSWGSYEISVKDVIKTLFGQGNKSQSIAIMQIRLPRILVGIFVGIALSTAGCILQTILKNDLADSGIVGINAGAAVAAVIFISYQTTDYYSKLGSLTTYILPLMAIIGASCAALIIYLLASQNGVKPKRLLLIGIGVNAGLNAFITFFIFRGGVGDYNRLLIWTSGSLWGSGWNYVKILLPIVAVVFIYVLLNHKTMDVMNLTDELATGLGVNVEKVRKKMLVCAVILAGSATAFAGNIGFLGLISPHIARKLVGPYHKSFMIISALISIVIILIADSVSRNMFSPIEIPVGIIVSIFGVPYFIYLLMKEK